MATAMEIDSGAKTDTDEGTHPKRGADFASDGDGERIKRIKTSSGGGQHLVVRAAVPDQVASWHSMRTPTFHQHSIQTPMGMAGANIPGVTVGGIPGLGPLQADRRAIEEQRKSGPVNWTFTAIPFKSMMSHDPIWRETLSDIPEDQIEQFLLARQEPIFCDNGLARANLAIRQGAALCSLRAVNRYLLIAAKAAAKGAQAEAAARATGKQYRRASWEKMPSAAAILERFKLLGMLVNLDNPAPELPSERAVQTATITICNAPHSNMPNFWQAYTHNGLATAYMAFKLELINAAPDVEWTIENCRPGVHSPYLTAGPVPDQTIHKIRPGGRKEDDLLAWCLIPQVVRNSKALSTELTVVNHARPRPVASPAPVMVAPAPGELKGREPPVRRAAFWDGGIDQDLDGGSGALFYFGMRNHENQWGRALNPHECMQMLTPITSADIPKMQQRGNELFDRINVIIKRGVYSMGASITHYNWDQLYPSRERRKRFDEVMRFIQPLLNAEKSKSVDGGGVRPPTGTNALGTPAGGDSKHNGPPAPAAAAAAPAPAAAAAPAGTTTTNPLNSAASGGGGVPGAAAPPPPSAPPLASLPNGSASRGIGVGPPAAGSTPVAAIGSTGAKGQAPMARARPGAGATVARPRAGILKPAVGGGRNKTPPSRAHGNQVGRVHHQQMSSSEADGRDDDNSTSDADSEMTDRDNFTV